VIIAENSVKKLALEVLDIEADSILKLKERLDKNFESAIETLYTCKGRVIVTGMGKSGHVGRKIAATLSSLGTPSYFLHPAESTHGDSGIITREDVVIAISNSGETAELLNLLPLIKRFNVPLVAMVGKTPSTLAQKADIVLDVSVEKEACPLGKAPTASTTATLALGDALAVCLVQKRGFSIEDFLLYHPSGSLGKGVLYRAQDLMITGDSVALANQDEDFQKVVGLISEKRLGSAILTDENGFLAGILTDGDIRRTLLKYPDIKNLKAKDVMTKGSKTIAPEELAAKALAIMEKFSITSLVVVDTNNKPLGLLHIHDLLKAGVA